MRTDRLSIVSTLDLIHHPDGAPAPVYSLDPSGGALSLRLFQPDELADLGRLSEPAGAGSRTARSRPMASGFDTGYGAAEGRWTLVEAMTHAIQDRVGYNARYEEGTQTAAETLELGTRHLPRLRLSVDRRARCPGSPTRFVTGYLYDDQIGTTRGGGSPMPGAVYLPGAGSIEYDPTNGFSRAPIWSAWRDADGRPGAADRGRLHRRRRRPAGELDSRRRGHRGGGVAGKSNA